MSGTLKKNTSLRLVWSSNMEQMLLDLWAEKIEELRGARKNSHVYQEMATTMQDAGFSGTWVDIRTKIDNLTRRYKQEKNKIGPTDGAPSSWIYYNNVHNILGTFKLHIVEKQMYESTDLSNLIDDVIEVDLDATCSSQHSDFTVEQGPQAKKRKVDINTELVRLAQERVEMQRQQQEGKKEQVAEIIKRLDNISAQNAAFQSQLLEILREKK